MKKERLLSPTMTANIALIAVTLADFEKTDGYIVAMKINPCYADEDIGITAKAPNGTTYISSDYELFIGKSAQTRDTVYALNTYSEEVHITDISLDKTDVTVVVGGVFGISASITPQIATNKNTTWTSSNTDVVEVVDGVVTPKAIGNATITATTQDVGKSVVCNVTVSVPVTGV